MILISASLICTFSAITNLDVHFFLNIITTGSSRKVNLTHSAHGAYGYAELTSDSSVRLTELYYDGAGSQISSSCNLSSFFGRAQDQLDCGYKGLYWCRQQYCDH